MMVLSAEIPALYANRSGLSYSPFNSFFGRRASSSAGVSGAQFRRLVNSFVGSLTFTVLIILVLLFLGSRLCFRAQPLQVRALVGIPIDQRLVRCLQRGKFRNPRGSFCAEVTDRRFQILYSFRTGNRVHAVAARSSLRANTADSIAPIFSVNPVSPGRPGGPACAGHR